jgi:hypothetical protein
LLKELDQFLGESRAARGAETSTVVRTVKLRSIGAGSAFNLLAQMASDIERQIVPEDGTIVLRGTQEAVARAESLLREVDQPAPQMTMQVTLIEALDSAPSTPVGGELGKALTGLMPGKQFQQVGRFMLRASVAGNSPVQISSSFGNDSNAKAKFSFQAESRSWDSERRVLTLGGCHVQNERPRYNVVTGRQQPVGAGESAMQQVLAGYDQEGFSTDLSLNMGQETVVGSLGGNALLVVLRFTVDASVD